MKIINVVRIAVLTLVLFLGASSVAPLDAVDEEIDYFYYVGCENPTFVGSWTYWCDRHIYTSGQQSGDWMEVSTISCDPEVPGGSYAVYEWCTDHWRNADFLGDCRCDHP